MVNDPVFPISTRPERRQLSAILHQDVDSVDLFTKILSQALNGRVSPSDVDNVKDHMKWLADWKWVSVIF